MLLSSGAAGFRCVVAEDLLNLGLHHPNTRRTGVFANGPVEGVGGGKKKNTAFVVRPQLIYTLYADTCDDFSSSSPAVKQRGHYFNNNNNSNTFSDRITSPDRGASVAPHFDGYILCTFFLLSRPVPFAHSERNGNVTLVRSAPEF